MNLQPTDLVRFKFLDQSVNINLPNFNKQDYNRSISRMLSDEIDTIFEFKKMSKRIIEYYLPDDFREYVMGLGLVCEVLRIGDPGWRQGKIKAKVVIEFEPDEPDSPLEDIRQSL